MFSLHPRRLVGTKAKKVICAIFNERPITFAEVLLKKYWKFMHQRPKAPLAARWMNENEMQFTVPLFCEKRKWIGLCLLVFSFLVSLSYVHSSYHQLSTLFYTYSLSRSLSPLSHFPLLCCVCICTYVPSIHDDFLFIVSVRTLVLLML